MYKNNVRFISKCPFSESLNEAHVLPDDSVAIELEQFSSTSTVSDRSQDALLVS